MKTFLVVLSIVLSTATANVAHADRTPSLELIAKLLRLGERPVIEVVTAEQHLDQIFENFGGIINPNHFGRSEFTIIAESYKRDLKDAEDIKAVNRLISLVADYPAMFASDETQITFDSKLKYTYWNVRQLNWMNAFSRGLLATYGTDMKATAEQTKAFLDEFQIILVTFNLIDPSVTDMAKRLVTHADLFTFNANGDGKMGEKELTGEIAARFSNMSLANDVREVIEPRCAIKKDSQDAFGWTWMEATCFRREYFYRTIDFWSHAPQMQTYFDGLGAKAREKFTSHLENSGRRYGKSDHMPVGAFDTRTLVGVNAAIETLFQRFDTDADQRLDTDELITMFPLFKNTALGSSLSLYMYTIRFKHPPQTFGQKMRFLVWKAWPSLWKVKADRGSVAAFLASLH